MIYRLPAHYGALPIRVRFFNSPVGSYAGIIPEFTFRVSLKSRNIGVYLDLLDFSNLWIYLSGKLEIDPEKRKLKNYGLFPVSSYVRYIKAKASKNSKRRI